MSDYGSTPPPPPPSYGAPQVPGPGGTPPPNYLVFAILTTIFCCLPLGIASIVFSAQVNTKWGQGDVAGAADASAKARRFAIWAAIVGVVLYILWGILVAAGVSNINLNTSN